MTDCVQSNPPIDFRPIDSNIDNVVARQLVTSRPLCDSGRIEVVWGALDHGVNSLFNDVGV